MTDIRELDQETVERIAAGEVVERPASVVKELVENSLDAGASRIEVAVSAGGTERVRVTDDGAGMTEDELRRAVEEHTTSKITDIGDLEGGVGTLGFRGEALHAIGAVSRLTITTRPHADRHPEGDATTRGAELTVEGGEVTEVTPAGCPEGTTVEVTDLFYNVPARRKYLKQESTEFAHVNTVVTSYALANPEVAITLTHDGRETFATTGQGDLRETVMAVYGREVAESMVPVEAESPAGPLDGVSGLVSHPETNRASRDYLSTFVNGRYVRATTVRDAVVEAYDTQLAPDRYPFAVLDLTVDPAEVDVNVHPRKLEVRFAEEDAVREQVQTAVAEALLDAGLLRSSAPRGRSAPDQTEIDPSSAADRTEMTGTDSADGSTVDAADTADGPESHRSTDAGSTRTSPSRSEAGSDGPSSRSQSGSTSGSDSTAAPTQSSSHSRQSRSTVTNPPDTQTTLRGDEAHTTTEFETVPDLRVLGQLHDTYIVAEADDGLVLIDQHAADERINYERLQEQFEGDTTTQALAEPVRIELTAGESEQFDAFEGALARLGFQAMRVDDRTVEVATVPALVAEAAGPTVVREVLADLVDGQAGPEGTIEAIADDLLADMACYPSMTGNTSLTDGSVVELLSALDDCENPWACPHGRPVLIQIDSDEIEDRFERDYPGH